MKNLYFDMDFQWAVVRLELVYTVFLLIIIFIHTS